MRVERKALPLQLAVLLLLVYPFVSSTFRDNDQAAILSGAWQIAHRQNSFFHAVFYNFDKQWGTFLALSWLFRLFPHADPVLAGNVLLTALASLAWISLGIRMGRTKSVPLPLVLPILLSPVLILYMPYLGTGWFSLAFLLLGFFFLGARSKSSFLLAFLSVAAAAACRGDVILAVPALVSSQIARCRFAAFLRHPLVWLLGTAAIFPALLGRWLSGAVSPDTNPLSFDMQAYAGFLIFGLTPAVLVLMVGSAALFFTVGIRKRRFGLFYICLAAGVLIPLVFYSPQLYVLRYFFLSLASTLFVVSSRRSAWLYRSFSKRTSLKRISKRTSLLSATLVVLTIVPWLIGFNIPLLRYPSLTVSSPTRFPTGDGQFPMAAYLGFEGQVLFEDHSQVDHNQKIWLASRSVDYENCSDGTVPFLVTPMSNFIEFAIRLQNKRPKPIDDMSQSACGAAYADVRSILRGYRPGPPDPAFFKYRMSLVSRLDNGEPILQVDARGKETTETNTLNALLRLFGSKQVQIFAGKLNQIPITPGLRYAVFSNQPCRVSLNGRAVLATDSLIQATWVGSPKPDYDKVEVACPGTFNGWASTVLPPYMGL